jgi:hypothetical protein
MTRPRILCALLVASAVLACGIGVLWFITASKVTVSRARFNQVKEGMSREEVIRTVGGPPGDYSSSGYMPSNDGLEQWSCDDGLLLVHFGDDGTATELWVFKMRQPPTFTERIRRWLGL